MKKFLAIVPVLAAFLFLPVLCSAQEEKIDYSWGVVVKVTPQEVTVLEYDYDLDEEVEIVYKVGRDTEFRSMAALNDLKEGDSVEIDYVLKGGNKVAKIISLEESFIEEEYPSEEELSGEESKEYISEEE